MEEAEEDRTLVEAHDDGTTTAEEDNSVVAEGDGEAEEEVQDVEGVVQGGSLMVRLRWSGWLS